jgi:hypothetical protein
MILHEKEQNHDLTIFQSQEEEIKNGYNDICIVCYQSNQVEGFST